MFTIATYARAVQVTSLVKQDGKWLNSCTQAFICLFDTVPTCEISITPVK